MTFIGCGDDKTDPFSSDNLVPELIRVCTIAPVFSLLFVCLRFYNARAVLRTVFKDDCEPTNPPGDNPHHNHHHAPHPDPRSLIIGGTFYFHQGSFCRQWHCLSATRFQLSSVRFPPATQALSLTCWLNILGFSLPFFFFFPCCLFSFRLQRDSPNQKHSDEAWAGIPWGISNFC